MAGIAQGRRSFAGEAEHATTNPACGTKGLGYPDGQSII
eukprot:CAMPEP_0177386694 /NCGR_PEP_ID=MMETSP0368-20130122/50936_1 /TAXON_ID=447022 ORGANISM="Scrippsiella hangoei-like, Strain SHHI-4" /NCGR_SAMPLE_ID=MMETSP0368 /ASSEMBLY_ACC=CAM_ASM_000363 /LENGTH=38 /DNA_ID= /DNA_START= /DNA_END= /DNA_ORIENTATION=